jgi:hypothetical protein
MHTKTIGQITEAAVALSLLKPGKTVLTPYGENQRYDLVMEEVSGFKTIQCKTGRYQNGCIVFNLYSVVRDKETKKYVKHSYGASVDYYGVYCAELAKVFLVPSAKIGSIEGRLRIDHRLNEGGGLSLWAKEFEI